MFGDVSALKVHEVTPAVTMIKSNGVL